MNYTAEPATDWEIERYAGYSPIVQGLIARIRAEQAETRHTLEAIDLLKAVIEDGKVSDVLWNQIQVFLGKVKS